MQPNDPNQQPIDYLEEISTNQNTPGMPMSIKILAGVCLVLLLTIVGWMVFAPKDTSALDLTTLQHRVEISGKITEVGKKNIKNEELLKLNSELTVFLSDFSRDIGVEITGDVKKKPTISTKIKTQESIKESLDELNDARLAGKFDEKFRSIMQLRLESIDNLAELLEKRGKNKTKEFMSKKRQELKTYYNRLSEINLSKS